MANLVGCVAMSHAPQLMLDPGNWHLLQNRQSENLPDKPGLENETDDLKWTKWRGCISAIEKLRARIESLRPDVLIVVGDDQHENLVDDNMPPFMIYMGEEAEASVSLRYLKQSRSENRTKYRIDAKLAEALITGLMDHGFDPSYSKKARYDGGLGHAFARVLKFLVPDAALPSDSGYGEYVLSTGAVGAALLAIRTSPCVDHSPVSGRRPGRHRRFRRTEPHKDR